MAAPSVTASPKWTPAFAGVTVDESAEARLREASRLCNEGRLGEAQGICEQLLAEHPDYVAALFILGRICIARRDHGQALPHLVRAAMHNPFDFQVLSSLGGTYMALGAGELAAQTLERAVSLRSDMAEPHFNLGRIYLARREFERAAQCFERALTLKPRSRNATLALGDCLQHQGNLKEAAELLQRAMSLDPASPEAILALSELPPGFLRIDLLAAIDRFARAIPDGEGELASELALARARALDGLGRHREAWQAAAAANARLHAQRKERLARETEEQKRQVAAAQFLRPGTPRSRNGGNAPLTLFLLGPSRAGKTTLERLLAACAGVRRGYENPIVTDAVRRTHQLAGRPGDGSIARLPEALHPSLAELYEAELSRRAAGFRVFTNTFGGLLAEVGSAIAALPHCRFVFVTRNRDDQAVRIYYRYYRSGNAYAYDIGAIDRFLSWYYRMIDTWVGKFPDLAMTIAYEEIVENPAAALERVARFCGLAMSTTALPPTGDDRDCAAPYRQWLNAARITSP
jgi:tetratricopeptide (TPR) repeat protein